MEVTLYHKHYNEQHLEEVKSEMQSLGAPVIRCIWSETYDMWMAIEGCHRLRAASALGVIPVIQDITNDEAAIIQIDKIDTEVNVADLAVELTDDVWQAEIIEF